MKWICQYKDNSCRDFWEKHYEQGIINIKRIKNIFIREI